IVIHFGTVFSKATVGVCQIRIFALPNQTSSASCDEGISQECTVFEVSSPSLREGCTGADCGATLDGGGSVMKKIYRNIGIGIAAFIALLLVLPLFINVNSFRPKIESELSNTLGRKVEVGDLSLSILRGSVSAANIRIADDPAFSKSPFLTAKSLRIGVELMPLIFSKQLNITGIALDEPSIALLSSPSGKWNFSSLGTAHPKHEPKSGGASPSGNLSIEKLRVTDGR